MSKTQLAAAFAMVVAAIGEILRAFNVYSFTPEQVSALNDGFGALLLVGGLVFTTEHLKVTKRLAVGLKEQPPRYRAPAPVTPKTTTTPVTTRTPSGNTVSTFTVTEAPRPAVDIETGDPPPLNTPAVEPTA